MTKSVTSVQKSVAKTNLLATKCQKESFGSTYLGQSIVIQEFGTQFPGIIDTDHSSLAWFVIQFIRTL